VKVLKLLYVRVKASPVLRNLYYSVANMQYFASLLEQERMLADRARVEAYYKGIRRHVREGDVVVDLGAGTGILSHFAASMRPQKVYALEHGGIIEVAREVARHNAATAVEFVSMHSTRFEPPEKVDVIVHEQMGAILFDEHMVENVVDLRDRVLKKGGRILPNRFELFVEPVKIRDDVHVPLLWEQEIHGVRFDCVRAMPGRGDQCSQRLVKSTAIEYLLAEPEPVLSFDLETVTLGELPKRIESVRTVCRDGRLDGFCIYFVAAFDDDVSLGTGPMHAPTHWSNALLRVESRECNKGEVLELTLDMGDVTDLATYRWRYVAHAPGQSGGRPGVPAYTPIAEPSPRRIGR
jgi:protein arginine N-methyltransferase 1